MNFLRPVMTNESPSRRATVRRARGVRPRARRRLGHREGRPLLPAGQRGQEPLALGPDGHLLEQVHVALVGGVDVDRHRSEQRPTGRLEHRCAVRHPQAEAARARPATWGANTPASLALRCSSTRRRSPPAASTSPSNSSSTGSDVLLDEGPGARRDHLLAASIVDLSVRGRPPRGAGGGPHVAIRSRSEEISPKQLPLPGAKVHTLAYRASARAVPMMLPRKRIVNVDGDTRRTHRHRHGFRHVRGVARRPEGGPECRGRLAR